jgi:hypothetical protein
MCQKAPDVSLSRARRDEEMLTILADALMIATRQWPAANGRDDLHRGEIRRDNDRKFWSMIGKRSA